MERRSALKLMAVGLGVLTQRLNGQQTDLQFFTQGQHDLIDRLSEMIIPADERSGGAHEAEIGVFIDAVVAASPADEQAAWKQGVAAVEAEAQRRFGSSFLAASSAQGDELLAAIAAAEASPKTDAERFFVRLKRWTVRGYYASAVGLHRELQYQGNIPLADYPGCDHPEHGA